MTAVMDQPWGWGAWGTGAVRDPAAVHELRVQYGIGGTLNWSCVCQPPVGVADGVVLHRPLGPVNSTLDAVVAAHAAHTRRVGLRSVS